jgi:hypothetical protein
MAEAMRISFAWEWGGITAAQNDTEPIANCCLAASTRPGVAKAEANRVQRF